MNAQTFAAIIFLKSCRRVSAPPWPIARPSQRRTRELSQHAHRRSTLGKHLSAACARSRSRHPATPSRPRHSSGCVRCRQNKAQAIPLECPATRDGRSGFPGTRRTARAATGRPSRRAARPPPRGHAIVSPKREHSGDAARGGRRARKACGGSPGQSSLTIDAVAPTAGERTPRTRPGGRCWRRGAAGQARVRRAGRAQRALLCGMPKALSKSRTRGFTTLCTIVALAVALRRAGHFGVENLLKTAAS